MLSNDKTQNRGDTLVVGMLALAGILATLYWLRLGIPVNLAAAPSGRIACVSYSPYYKEGEAPFDPTLTISAVRIENDLRALSQRFDCVRTYSVGKGMADVPRIARKFGMKVLLGVWLNRNPVDNEEEMKVAAELARAEKEAGSNTIAAIIVGNEVLLRGELPQEKLAAHIRRVRADTGLPVTYADVWEFWLRYREVEKAVDFVTIHILPYWEDEPVSIEHAIEHVRAIHAQMRAAFRDKEFLIGETGWPSAGRQRRGAVPSVVNEARFFREFLAFAQQSGVRYNVIEAFDQPWKRVLEGTVGGYWGIFDGRLEPKFPMTGPVVEDARWPLGLAAGVVFALLLLLAAVFNKAARSGYGFAVLALSGYATGAVLAAELRHMLFANRFGLEWAITGSWTLLALVTTGGIALLLARRGPELAAAPIAEFRSARGPARWLGLLRAMWLFAIVVVDLLLVFDARYRDFPTLLCAPAVVAFVALALSTRNSATSSVQIEERVMAAAIAVMGLAILVFELPVNTSALAWVGIGWLFALTVLIGGNARTGLAAS